MNTFPLLPIILIIAIPLSLLFLIFLVVLVLSIYITIKQNEPVAAEEETFDINMQGSKLVFKNLNYTVDGTQLLENINGYVKPGQVLAILGPSGAGKTTLLEVLSQRKSKENLTGSILVDDLQVTNREIQEISSYVQQHDSLIPYLTVRESLFYFALFHTLHTSKICSIKSNIEKILKEMKLDDVADNIIGTLNGKGVSGGERKRINIAQSLVISPNILFIDEPTSGLDSNNSYSVINTIIEVAKNRGTSVVITIHQPRASFFLRFDNVLLISRGKNTYFGKPSEIGPFFDDLGFTCPNNMDIADYVIYQVSTNDNFDTGYWARGPPEAGAPRLNMTVDSKVKYIAEKYIEYTNWAESQREIESPVAGPVVERVAEKKMPLHVVSIYRFFVLCSRSLLTLYRSPIMLQGHFLITVCIGLFCGVLFANLEFDMAGFQNRMGLIFFVICFISFTCLSLVAELSDEKRMFEIEKRNGFYGSFAYVFSKLFLDIIPLRVFCPMVLGFIIYPLCGLKAGTSYLLKFVFGLGITGLCTSGVCLLISSIFSNHGIAILASILVFLFSLLFGGMLRNQDNISPVFIVFKYLSWIRYSFEGLIGEEVKEVEFEIKGLLQIPGEELLESFGFEANKYWTNMMVLCLASYGCYLLASIVLMIKMPVRER